MGTFIIEDACRLGSGPPIHEAGVEGRVLGGAAPLIGAAGAPPILVEDGLVELFAVHRRINEVWVLTLLGGGGRALV